MIRSLAFTTQGRLHSKDIEMFLMPTLLERHEPVPLGGSGKSDARGKQVCPGGRVSFPSAVDRRLRDGQSVAESGGIPAEGRRPVYAVSVHGDSRGGLQPQRRRVRHERAEFLSGQEFSGHLPRGSHPQRCCHGGTRRERHHAHRARAGPRRTHAAGFHRGQLQAGAG